MKKYLYWANQNAKVFTSAVTHADSLLEAFANTKLYKKISDMQPHQIRTVFLNNEKIIDDTSLNQSKVLQSLLDDAVTISGHSSIVREYILKKHITSLHLIDFQKLFINLIGKIDVSPADFFCKNPDEIQPEKKGSMSKFFEALDQFFAAVLEKNYFPEQIVSKYDGAEELTPEKELQMAFLGYAHDTDTVDNKIHTHLSAYIVTVLECHQQQKEYATEGFQKFRSIKPKKIAALATLASQLKDRQTNPIARIVDTLPGETLASLEAYRINPSRVKKDITDPFRDTKQFPPNTSATFHSSAETHFRKKSPC